MMIAEQLRLAVLAKIAQAGTGRYPRCWSCPWSMAPRSPWRGRRSRGAKNGVQGVLPAGTAYHFNGYFPNRAESIW